MIIRRRSGAADPQWDFFIYIFSKTELDVDLNPPPLPSKGTTMTISTLKKWTQLLLFYTLLVILWGAWVRISHSGDGCGKSWPLCGGQLIPGEVPKKTWVEYFHRATSGIFGIYVFILFLVSKRLLQKGTLTARLMSATLFFTITEALLGAKLVLFGLVSDNDSYLRVFAMGLHQINSLLLMGTVFLLTMSLSSLEKNQEPRQLFTKKWHHKLFTGLFILVAVFGAWAALASTLFPSEALWEGLQKDFSADSHYLIRGRFLHPLLAVLIGGGLGFYYHLKAMNTEASTRLHKVYRQTSIVFLGAVLFGAMTLMLLSPVWMKLCHLAIAHLAWMSLLRVHYKEVVSEDSAKR